LSELLEGYKPCDIFNADETALFYKCMPDKILTFKNEKCNGGKHSKERQTLLLAVNMTGTDKLKPLITEKSKKPRYFAGVKSFPVDYTANKKAWVCGMAITNRRTNENTKTYNFIVYRQLPGSQYYIDLSSCKSKMFTAKYHFKIATFGPRNY